MTRVIFSICLIAVFGCKGKNVNDTPETTRDQPVSSEVNSRTALHRVRLGQSDYYLQLPDNFRISEARGKEGQLGYNIIPKDSSSTTLGLIEIVHGSPIEGNIRARKKAKFYMQSVFLGKQVNWKIIKSETGYFEAFTSEDGDLNAWATSKKVNQVDSLISIISTLTRK